MPARTRQFGLPEDREIVNAEIARKTNKSMKEIIKKSRETVAETRELMANVDKILARR